MANEACHSALYAVYVNVTTHKPQSYSAPQWLEDGITQQDMNFNKLFQMVHTLTGRELFSTKLIIIPVIIMIIIIMIKSGLVNL